MSYNSVVHKDYENGNIVISVFGISNIPKCDLTYFDFRFYKDGKAIDSIMCIEFYTGLYEFSFVDALPDSYQIMFNNYTSDIIKIW